MADTKEQPQTTLAPPPPHAEKAKPGAAWKDGETHVLPKNNLPIVFTALGFCTFLAALDQVSPLNEFIKPSLSSTPLGQTIVATALPTIVRQLQGGAEYSWVGRYAMCDKMQYPSCGYLITI
jgi:hypothetical protein